MRIIFFIMQTIYKITFNHPNYSPLDSMPIGMNERFIKADSDMVAKSFFEAKYPTFAGKITSIEDTGSLTLEDAAKFCMEGLERIEEIERFDKDKGYISFNTPIKMPEELIDEEPEEVIKKRRDHSGQ